MFALRLENVMVAPDWLPAEFFIGDFVAPVQ
jgi:hypothetical protein